MRPRRKKGKKLTKSEQMARVRSRDTDPEMLLRRTLWSAGLRFRVRLSLPGTPDIAFVGPKVAVFVDGCFWHGCPIHYTKPATNEDFWRRKLERNLRRDRLVDEELKSLGWSVIRIWEHEIADDLPAVVARLYEAVKGGKIGQTN